MSIELRNEIRRLASRLEQVEGERVALRKGYTEVLNGIDRLERKVDAAATAGVVEVPKRRLSIPFPRCLRELGYEAPPQPRRKEPAA